MPLNFEKIQNIIRVPPYGFGGIPEPPRGPSQVGKGPNLDNSGITQICRRIKKKNQNLVRIPTYGFGGIPEPPGGSSQVGKGPPFQLFEFP